ncbi:M23 family metallopeptidase [Massilia sp. RP-1-19]|uniref:M23 family metallopeptidase n=1 Tax=Massilia polaris TaxID=2728846 RepID=A0A848HPZ3_9BURK|nr:M23 family metallopeptidase [Massilia polaris]NML61871.1 M23 family metallopeptidase [Massilia polaris]
MKWILTFIGGTLLGVIALFIYLRKVGTEAPPPPVVVPSAITAPAAPAPTAAALPGAPDVPPDLTEADLPIRPAPSEVPAIAKVDGVTSTATPKLMIPVEGIKASDLSDTYNQTRGTERTHEALDILAPKGAKVFATADGKVAKLFNSKQGGLTVYQFDPSESYAYYYAHLDRYADGIKEGDVLKRGDLVGYVGVTGNSDPNGPHLHFAVFELTAEKQWWKGAPVNPYPLMGEPAPASTPVAAAPTR